MNHGGMKMLKNKSVFVQGNQLQAVNRKEPNRSDSLYRAIYYKLMSRINEAVQDAEEEMNQITP
jgi:hypothetical protein